MLPTVPRAEGWASHSTWVWGAHHTVRHCADDGVFHWNAWCSKRKWWKIKLHALPHLSCSSLLWLLLRLAVNTCSGHGLGLCSNDKSGDSSLAFGWQQNHVQEPQQGKMSIWFSRTGEENGLGLQTAFFQRELSYSIDVSINCWKARFNSS